MKISVRNIIKRMMLLMSVLMLAMACTSFVYAQDEKEATGENIVLPKEAEFEDEEAPLASVPGDEGSKVAVTPFNILSAIGSYSLLIPALIVAGVALIFAAVYRRKDKSETAKQ